MAFALALTALLKTRSAGALEALPSAPLKSTATAPSLAPVVTNVVNEGAPQQERLLRPDKPSFTFGLGLIQPLALGGANVQGDFRLGHLVVDYSHGWNLQMRGAAIVGEMQRQRIELRIPFTTGFGVGYSSYVAALHSFFDIRLEGKLHRFEASYASADGKQTTVFASYNTVTLGAGAYWTYLPFAGKNSALRGIEFSTSLRFWPRVASTLSGNEIAYSNSSTGKSETHQAANIGIANTPIIFNISAGYLFQ
jgi:hypothetical protein